MATLHSDTTKTSLVAKSILIRRLAIPSTVRADAARGRWHGRGQSAEVGQATALRALVDEPPQGPEWLHEIKYDGYRMHARLDHGKAQLLTRTGLDWTHKYPPIAAALSALPLQQAYFDGELCGIRSDGKTSFSLIQAASDTGNADALVFFPFDLLYLDGDVISSALLLERKERLRGLLSGSTRRRGHHSRCPIGPESGIV